MQNIKSSRKSGVARPWRVQQVLFPLLFSILVVCVRISSLPPINAQQHHQGTGFKGIRSPDVIESLCNKTRYVDVCISSLSPYPDANLWEFGRIAVEVSLNESVSVKDFILNLNGNCSVNCAPLVDCVENLDDTNDQLNDSLSKLADPNWAQNASDVKTYLSAASTNLNSCVEGFCDLGVDMPQNMKEKLEYLCQLISNALAIVAYLSGVESYVGAGVLCLQESCNLVVVP